MVLKEGYLTKVRREHRAAAMMLWLASGVALFTLCLAERSRAAQLEDQVVSAARPHAQLHDEPICTSFYSNVDTLLKVTL